VYEDKRKEKKKRTDAQVRWTRRSIKGKVWRRKRCSRNMLMKKKPG
jgi:hypothetical protein